MRDEATVPIISHLSYVAILVQIAAMRYLLSPDEERHLLRNLKIGFGLSPLVPLDSDEYPGELEVLSESSQGDSSQPDRHIFWANEIGPIRYLGDRAEPCEPVERAMLRLNQHAGMDQSAVDLETTPIVSWSRTKWFDEGQRWVVPSRLGSTRAPLKTLSPEYRKMLRSIERSIQHKGKVVNSWDIPNTPEATGLMYDRPSNTQSYLVTVWPEAAKWLDQGVKIYHWDA